MSRISPVIVVRIDGVCAKQVQMLAPDWTDRDLAMRVAILTFDPFQR
jgi:hypothetical protein